VTTAASVPVRWEAQGSVPHYRVDQIQPLLQGRVKVEGVEFLRDDPMVNAGFYENDRFRDGDFGLLDIMWGETVPAIANGWDLVLLPIVTKRKPVYDYLWVRTDHGIESPKDLEGRLVATTSYASAITIFTRGFLEHFYGVDLSKLSWLVTGPARFGIHKDVGVEFAEGPRKSPMQRLLDGEVDACTGDITDAKVWAAMDASPDVKLMFPDFPERNRLLFREHGIVTPVHLMAMGGKLNRAHPELAMKLFDAFEQSRLLAYDDALGDGTGYSLTVHHRLAFEEQLREWGDVWKHGISANRNTIDTFLDYCFEQGVTKTRLALDQVFPATTLNT
jgi:4,5-dihydroxyphthalate decarboxylase